MKLAFKKLFIYSAILTLTGVIEKKTLGIPHSNLFQPYDFLLFRPNRPGKCFQFNVTTESTFKVRSFQASKEDSAEYEINSENEIFSDEFRKKANVLELWGGLQNYAESFSNPLENKKIPTETPAVLLLNAQAELEIPINLMMAAQVSLPRNLTLGVYLPFYKLKLHKICWKIKEFKKSRRGPKKKGKKIKKGNEEEIKDPQKFLNRKLSVLEEFGEMDLRKSWEKSGIGDLAVILWWNKNYPQFKRWLRNVQVGIRGGGIFPTGKKAGTYRLFDLPLGYDAGSGMLLGGTLELGFRKCVKIGIDAEFSKLFGSQRIRRIKTKGRLITEGRNTRQRLKTSQTDLMFANKTLTHIDPGFMLHYTVYLKLENFWNNLSAMLAYQHTSQHESTISADTARALIRPANNADSLQDWTYHNMIFSLNYNFCCESRFSPSISAFVKYGFNGKRVISANTAGVQISCNF